MTDAEYALVVAYVSRLWPHQRVVEGMWDAWRRFVDDLTIDETISAVDRLAAEGREFPPPPGLIRREAIMCERIPLLVRGDEDDDSDYWERKLQRERRLVALPQLRGENDAAKRDIERARPARRRLSS